METAYRLVENLMLFHCERLSVHADLTSSKYDSPGVKPLNVLLVPVTTSGTPPFKRSSYPLALPFQLIVAAFWLMLLTVKSVGSSHGVSTPLIEMLSMMKDSSLSYIPPNQRNTNFFKVFGSFSKVMLICCLPSEL